MKGIITIADLLDRCRLDDTTGCWLWGLASTHDGQPKGGLVNADGTRTHTTIGRIAWTLAHGKPAKDHVVYRRLGCSKLCCNPKHLHCGTKGDAGLVLRQSGRLRGDPMRQIINGRNRASKRTVIDLEKAREIRASSESASVLALRMGTSKTTINATRRGERWREVVRGASVFSLGSVA